MGGHLSRKISRAIFVGLLTLVCHAANAQSLRFHGNGVNDIDRVKIRIDDPASYSDPGVPADVGATDFTIEMWLKPASDNGAARVSCGTNYSWISGNIVFDRDRFNQGRSFGMSLGAGQVAFGIKNGSGQARTLCGGPDLRDGSWHHVAVQRRRSDGYLWLYVDGQLRAEGSGPSGDVSYPNDGVPGNHCGSSRNQPCTNSDPFIVLAAEKHDYDSRSFPAFRGWIDELRISRTLRYSGNFSVPAQAFQNDSNTAALYHFDEGSGNDVIDSIGNLSPGVRRYGGNPAGPIWSSDTPFAAASTGQVAFTLSSYSGREAEGPVVVTVSRTGGSAGPASVNYSISNGSAVAGADFSAATGTLQWASGQSGERTFSVPIIDDASTESAESATLLLTNAVGAVLGSRTSAALNIADNDAPSSSPSGGSGSVAILDTFGRADAAALGNGWLEKTPSAFSLSGGRVVKHSTATDYRNNLVYRPAAEDVANVEVAAEFRLTASSVGYPMVVARLQNASSANGFSGYLLAIAGSPNSAVISRQNGSSWDSILTRMTLSSALNTTDTYRLRLRVVGTSSVTLSGFVERLNGTSWQTIGTATTTDSSASRISTGGSVGLSADVESGFSFDNFSRSPL